MIKQILRYIINRIDRLIPDQEVADLGLPYFHVGDLIENVHPTRPHVLLDNVYQKALIIGVRLNEVGWCYDILLDGALWTGVSAKIVEGTWRLSTSAAIIDTTEECN